MRARTLILAHLGLAVGCKKTPALSVDAGSIPTIEATTATAPPPPVPSSTATVTPSATVASSGSATPLTIPLTITTPSKLKPGQCFSAADCGGRQCALTNVKGEPGWCISSHRMGGRPLFVDGQARLARGVSATALERAAREEHASIAAFARTICELMSIGAPMWLVEETQRALADEIRHTEITLALIERKTNARVVLSDFPEATAPLKRSADEMFRDVFRGGAIGETLATAAAERDRLAATDEEVRAHHETIVLDEARHAALAFKTLRWLLVREPSLASVRDDEIARFDRDASSFERALVSPLFDALA